ncbi:suppressor of cytokine signaling 2 isoform X3 [Phyllobates terribilis]|uniref:suppressor of cytokine signaling 2 isoform X3 n=1 Tax=Phyllobates terribilis TaxID=111132 RepID=UPI003CCADBD7
MTLRSPDTADSTGTIDSGAGHRGTPPGDTQGSADKDERVAMSLGELRRSGWYWGHMTVNEAKEKLQDASEGTFLVRDSSHTDYLLTISVKTSAGPTNLRIEYREGKFRLSGNPTSPIPQESRYNCAGFSDTLFPNTSQYIRLSAEIERKM